MTVNWNNAHLRIDKNDLMNGITQWISQETGIENARLTYLYQLTIQDLTLLAMSMGFKPPANIEKNIYSHFRREHLDGLKREATRAVRHGDALPMPAPDDSNAAS